MYFSITDKTFSLKKRRSKECTRNAFEVVSQNDNFVYVEGYASCLCFGGFFTPHAWVADSEGNAYDPTWEDATQYFGVPFDWEFASKHVYSSGMYGVFERIVVNAPPYVVPREVFCHPYFLSAEEKKKAAKIRSSWENKLRKMYEVKASSKSGIRILGVKEIAE